MTSTPDQPSHRTSSHSAESPEDVLAAPWVGRVGAGAALLGGVMWLAAAVLIVLTDGTMQNPLIYLGLLVLFVAVVISGLALDPSAALEARVAIAFTLAVGVVLIWVVALTLLRGVVGVDTNTGTAIALVVGGVPALALGLLSLRRRRGVTAVAGGVG